MFELLAADCKGRQFITFSQILHQAFTNTVHKHGVMNAHETTHPRLQSHGATV
ncbi:MAG: hypothetical protein R3242_00650 [Akkermansiaceae bacterium]|nr:hypothetical protein [Akkermansiaceae bacterium]